MAKLGSTPNAMRYDGVATGPHMAYLFENQGGVPVDGTDAKLRQYSPFVLRFIVPDALLSSATDTSRIAEELTAIAEADAAIALTGGDAAQARAAQSALDAARAQTVASLARNVGLIQSAAIGSDTTTAANAAAYALSTVSAVGNLSNENVARLESFVATGKFVTQQRSGFISTLADAFMAADVSLQLVRLLQAEPLQLLVSPTDMTINYPKIQSFQQRGRNGYIFEAWGNDQPTISITGQTAGFVAGDPSMENGLVGQVTGATGNPTGYQEASKRSSAAWQNFTSLYHFYRNNGYIYDTLGKSEAHLFIGGIAIDYDQYTYIGNIESFSFSFSADTPNKVQFELEFHVSKMYDNAQMSGAVRPLTSGPVNPAPQVDLGGNVSSQRLQNPVNTSTIPFDLLPR